MRRSIIVFAAVVAACGGGTSDPATARPAALVAGDYALSDVGGHVPPVLISSGAGGSTIELAGSLAVLGADRVVRFDSVQEEINTPTGLVIRNVGSRDTTALVFEDSTYALYDGPDRLASIVQAGSSITVTFFGRAPFQYARQ